MIKTLRITSIVAAVLAAIFLISLVIFGTRDNEQVEQFLNSESIIEKFNKTESNKAARGRNQTSPLVAQAKKFAKYLNPPPKPKPSAPSKPPVARKPSVPAPKPRKATAKFNLVGTSYYASQPERSLAFIDEPGKGMRWISQSSKVGHLVIDQIKDGIVVVRDGGRTFELSVPAKKQKSLIEGASPVSSAVESQNASESTASISSPPPPSGKDISRIAEFLKSFKESAKAGKSDSDGIEKIMSDLGSMRISSGEAERLKDLPKELTDPQQSSGRITEDPNQTRGRKIKRPARLRKPTLPRRR